MAVRRSEEAGELRGMAATVEQAAQALHLRDESIRLLFIGSGKTRRKVRSAHRHALEAVRLLVEAADALEDDQ